MVAAPAAPGATKPATDMICPSRLVEPSSGRLLLWRQLLGRGGFATCHKFVREESPSDDKSALAVKVITKASIHTPFLAERLRQELEIHASLSHPNIVRLLWHQSDAERHYLVLELCRYHSLSAMLRRRRLLTLPEAQHLCQRVAEACCYLHGLGVVHRDIKLENILLGEGMVVKLTDFGLAARIISTAAGGNTVDSRRRTRCGTVQYMAPEVLDRKAAGHSFGADVWSLGCVLAVLLTGKPPVRATSMEAALRSIWESPWSPPAALCPVTRAFLNRLLHREPDKRPSMAEVLRDPFFKLEPRLPTLPVSCLSQQPRLDRLMPKQQQQQPIRRPLKQIQAPAVASKKTQLKPQPPNKNLISRTPATVSSIELARAGQDDDRTLVESTVRNEQAAAAGCEPLLIAPGDHSRYLVLPHSAEAARTAAAALVRAALTANTDNDADLVESPDLATPLWVARWMDCTEQGLGFGYELSDGSIGVRFNDQCSLLRTADAAAVASSGCLQFYAANGEEQLLGPADRHADGMNKRLRLLEGFANYMRHELQLAGPTVSAETAAASAAAARVPAVTHFRHRPGAHGASLLCLSNGLVQVNCPDHLKLVLCPISASVTLIPPTGSNERLRAFSLADNVAPPSELRDRLHRCLTMLAPSNEDCSEDCCW